MSPRILVDATAMPPNRGGVGRNLQYLVPALDALGAELVVAAQPRDAPWLAQAAPHARVVTPGGIGSRPLRILWEQLGLPGLARREGAGVIFSPHYTMPLLASRPVAVALYDAIFFSHPRLHTPLKRAFFRFWIRRSLARAAVCVVPSEATHQELLAHAKPRADRIVLAPLGVDPARFHPPSASELAAARELVGAERWIAFLGTLEPRKNVPALIHAFEQLDDPTLVLALAGGKGWDPAVDEAIAASPARDRIRRLGFVPDEALPGLLGGSVLTCYPSLGEGFGFPVLEAMACGSTVITCPFLSLPEVGGDVAVYSQPDADSLAAALRTLLADDAERAERGRRGIERAAGFTWQASARRHLAAFEKAAN